MTTLNTEMPEYHKLPSQQPKTRTPERSYSFSTTPSARSNEDSQKQQQQRSRHRDRRWQLFIQQQQADRRLSHPISTSKGVRAPTTKGVPWTIERTPTNRLNCYYRKQFQFWQDYKTMSPNGILRHSLSAKVYWIEQYDSYEYDRSTDVIVSLVSLTRLLFLFSAPDSNLSNLLVSIIIVNQFC